MRSKRDEGEVSAPPVREYGRYTTRAQSAPSGATRSGSLASRRTSKTGVSAMSRPVTGSSAKLKKSMLTSPSRRASEESESDGDEFGKINSGLKLLPNGPARRMDKLLAVRLHRLISARLDKLTHRHNDTAHARHYNPSQIVSFLVW